MNMKSGDLRQWEVNIETMRKDLVKIGELCGWESDQAYSMAMTIGISNIRISNEKRLGNENNI